MALDHRFVADTTAKGVAQLAEEVVGWLAASGLLPAAQLAATAGRGGNGANSRDGSSGDGTAAQGPEAVSAW